MLGRLGEALAMAAREVLVGAFGPQGKRAVLPRRRPAKIPSTESKRFH